MKNNKKGFTLVELLAVVVVLIIIILIAVNAIRKNVDTTLDNTIKANAGMYVKGANSLISEKSITDPSYDEGTYSIEDLNNAGLKLSGTKPNGGYVLVSNAEVSIACLTYDGYRVFYANGSVTDPEKNECNPIDADFDYKGSEETFTVSLSGTYKIEAWGASGGDAGTSNDLVVGGYGGYSIGYVYLNKDDKLYVNVGGKGADGESNVEYADGGYNGGGRGARGGREGRYSGGGGGATSIAFKSGLLSTLSNNKNKVLMVAGGGGGSWNYPDNHRYRTNIIGHAGGYVANSCVSEFATVAGGSQTTGYSFGMANPSTTGESSGGGGGYYGGNSGSFCGAGGSGYIGNESLINKAMYCYNCSEFSNVPMKTISTTCINNDPTANCAKIGNGYAKITYISPDKQNNNSIKYLYNYGNEFTDITGGWLTQNIQGNGRSEKLSSSLHIWASSQGSSESRVYTKNAIDYTGYTKVNVIYEIVSTYTTGTYGGLTFLSGSKDVWFSKRGVGTYYDSVDISSLSSGILYFRDWDVNIKILSVWLSKD